MATSHKQTAQTMVCPFTGRHHHSAQPESPGICLDVIEVLDGFFTLEKRSATLDGSAPLRAAQGCKPFLDGNGAGFHLRLADPAVIQAGQNDSMLRLTDEGYAKAADGYASKIEGLVERGILVKGGYWHRELIKGFAWKKGNTLCLWTGYLVRPSTGVWLLVSGAFNRRCLVDVDEYVITDDGSFVPLILQLDLNSLRAKDTWLDTELACLIPLRPNVNMTTRSLRQQPEVGQSWCEFYDASYLDARAEGQYVGRYRKITVQEPVNETNEKAECQLVIAGGPSIHKVRAFDSFATATGRSRSHPAKHLLQFGVVRNICDLKVRWDGLAARDISAEVDEEAQQLRNDWSELYGAETLPSIEWLTQYMMGTRRGEPYVPITPWVFAVTPPGWSSLIDGFHLDGLDGMRGVISTDTHFGVLPLWQFYKPGRFTVSKGAPLARALPTPRRLLQAGFRQLSLNDNVLDER
jgi:hypothetical protein